MKKRFYLLLACVLCASSWLDAKTVVLYHTSDVHGHYMPTDVKTHAGDMVQIGGSAALANAVKREGGPVILLDSGDWFQGSPEGNLTKGGASIALMNKLGYAASAVGNHDFDYGFQNLLGLCSQARFPILAANMYDRSRRRFPCIKAYTVVNADGYKIAVVGMIPPDAAKATMASNIAMLNFTDARDEIKRAVAAIARENVDAIVVLSHQGICLSGCTSFQIPAGWQPTQADIVGGNIGIARAVPGKLAVIMGGHAHKTLPTGYFDKESGTMIAESGSNLSNVSRIVLDFDDSTRKLRGVSVKVLDLWLNYYGQDQEVTALLNSITQQVAPEMDKVIGRTNQPLDRFVPGRIDGPMPNWVSDAMASAAKTQIAIMNTAGIRSSIPAGPITMRQVFNVMPFDNQMVRMRMKGSQFIAAVQHAVKPDFTSSMQYSSAVKVIISASGTQVLINGQPADPNAVYTVALSDFLAGAPIYGEGTDKQNMGITIRDVLVRAVKSVPVIQVPQDIRIVRQ